MSHMSTVKTQVQNEQVFRKAAQELKLEHGVGQVEGYGGNVMKGMWVKLPGWTFPVAFGADGTLSFDNYSSNPPVVTDVRQIQSGYWGQVDELQKFLREYARQSVLQSAAEQGLTLLSEEEVENERVIELVAF